MDWFRMYGDMPDDPKIGTLSDAEFRTWVELLCAACKAGDEGNTKLTKETINWALRRDVTETVTTLSQRELVTINGDGEYIIKAWQKRQYKTDSSTERTRKYRENKKSKLNTGADIAARSVTVTGAERHSDAIEQNRTEQNKETPLCGGPHDETPKTSTDSKTKNQESELPDGFMQAWKAYPRRDGTNPRGDAVKSWRARIRDGETPERLIAAATAYARKIESSGKSGTEFVMQAVRFFGKSRPYEEFLSRQPEADGWWHDVGFGSRYEAENAGCTQFNAAQFRDGHRIEALA